MSIRRICKKSLLSERTGALAAAAIEEFELVSGFLEGPDKNGEVPEALVGEILSALSLFKETDEPSEPTDRVIFDSRSWMEGIPFTGISGKYWDVLLGRGLLLPAFEEGLVGIRQGSESRFTFVFPDDYHQEELRGKEVLVQAKIHKVFKAFNAVTVEDLKALGIRNRYAFRDLDLLREQNDILYYLALRDAEPSELLRTPGHFLNLVHKLAKLGKREEIGRLAGLVRGKPAALKALADTLAGSGKCSWALEFYHAVSESMRSSVLKRVQCLLDIGSHEEAMSLLETMSETSELQFQETLLQCLKAARPDSSRIPSLEHNVLELRIKAALERESMTRAAHAPQPVVHGLKDHDL